MIFSILDHEAEVQVNDKTRLFAGKSFTAKSAHEITTLTIKPELTASAIDCYAGNPQEWFLDWSYGTTLIDVGSENDELKFSEGGSVITTTLTAGTYTLSQYATELASKMTASGTQTYSGSAASGKITLSAPSAFQLESSDAQAQSFIAAEVSKVSHTSELVEYGAKIVTVYTSNGSESDTKTFMLKVYSEEGDKLFSSDGDLMAHEPDVLSWVQNGRSSFKNTHRRAQSLILAWLDEKGFCNAYGKKYTKRDIIDTEEVRQWSTFLTLRLIMQGLSNSVDDVFDRKAKLYEMHEAAARQRAVLRIDTNEDGRADLEETLSIYSGALFRR